MLQCENVQITMHNKTMNNHITRKCECFVFFQTVYYIMILLYTYLFNFFLMQTAHPIRNTMKARVLINNRLTS